MFLLTFQRETWTGFQIIYIYMQGKFPLGAEMQMKSFTSDAHLYDIFKRYFATTS